MYAAARVSPVSGARLSAPVYRVISQSAAVRRTQPAKSTGGAAVSQSAVLSSTPNNSTVAAAAPQTTDLSLGLLQSIVQPPVSNPEANLDYHDLRTALDSNNLTAAQQAYLRLQTDLYMPQQLSVMA